MKTEIIILALFSVSVYGQCPNCPPPVFPPNCEAPDCSLPENHQNHALFAHPDPNFYWQCMPWNLTHPWIAVERLCACGTVFNPNQSPPRCTFWDDRTWTVQCNWTRPPVLRLPCDPWCPDCGGDGGGEITVPTTVQTTAQPPVTEPTTITTTGPGPTNPPCNCPCIPCIWWPCMPCNPCGCNMQQE